MVALRTKAFGIIALSWVVGLASASAQTSNLSYQVANNTQDLQILEESIRSMRVEMDGLRRENNQLHQQVSGYESRIGNSIYNLATMVQVAQAIAKTATSLEARDEALKSEILQVAKQLAEWVDFIEKKLPSLSERTIEPGPTIKTEFPKNYPEAKGVVHVVRSGDNLSSIATQYGSTTDWIQNANVIPDANYLQVGQKLYIPIE